MLFYLGAQCPKLQSFALFSPFCSAEERQIYLAASSSAGVQDQALVLSPIWRAAPGIGAPADPECSHSGKRQLPVGLQAPVATPGNPHHV